MLRHKKILVFDFETTGLNPMVDQIIEVGAILYEYRDDRYQIMDTFNALVKTPNKLPFKIVEITHITDEMLEREGISEEMAFNQLSAMYDQDTLLVAYNISFDLGFLQAMWRKFYERHYEIKNDILDVMAVYKDRHKFPHKLDNVVETYAIEVKNTHRALDDVMATFEALLKMNEEKSNLPLYVNVIGYNVKYGISMPMRHIRYIPQGFNGLGEIEKALLK